MDTVYTDILTDDTEPAPVPIAQMPRRLSEMYLEIEIMYIKPHRVS